MLKLSQDSDFMTRSSRLLSFSCVFQRQESVGSRGFFSDCWSHGHRSCGFSRHCSNVQLSLLPNQVEALGDHAVRR